MPDNATPGDHSAGIVTSLMTASSGAAVALDRRLGARYYLRVSGTLSPAVGVSKVQVGYSGSLNPVSSAAATVTVRAAVRHPKIIGYFICYPPSCRKEEKRDMQSPRCLIQHGNTRGAR